MSYGIKVLDKDGYVNLHSDYSSIVYYGEMSLVATPQRPVYVDGVSMPESVKDTNYDMGWITQYQISDVNTDYLLPFYRPNFDGQQIGILDVIKKDATTWLVNLIYSGTAANSPRVFAFAPLTAIPKPTLSTYGLVVYDQNGGLVFTDSIKPLRVDDSVKITHPSTIRTADKGSCGRYARSCHVNFTPDVDYFSGVIYGNVTNSNTKLYHIVPSAYGGLAYKNYYEGSESCDNGFGSRKYAYNYQSWASFRGTVSHPFYRDSHITGWLADFAGATYKDDASGCSYGGVFALVLGTLAVIFTGGGALAFVAGYLVAFALSTPAATPSLKAYETDQVFDTNNPSNLIITDASYYGIDGLTPPGSIDETPADEKTYYDAFTGEAIYIPNKKFWLDSYDTTGTTWLSTHLKDDTAWPRVDKTFTNANNGTYQSTIIDTLSGNVYTQGSFIMTYPDNSSIYKVNRRSFNYYSSTTGKYIGAYKWVLITSYYYTSRNPNYTGSDYPRYYLKIYWNNFNDTYITYASTLNPDITSYTVNGYTYYRGYNQKVIPDDPTNYNYDYISEYSIYRTQL
jgi:hypothetical protein